MTYCTPGKSNNNITKPYEALLLLLRDQEILDVPE